MTGVTNPCPRVLLVGRGAPEQGGIAVFLDGLLRSPLAERTTLSLLNLTRPDEMDAGGRVTVGNVRRTLVDGWRVLRAARHVDVVHIHSSLGATSTVLRAGLLAWCARRAGAAVLVHAHGGKAISWLEGDRARRVMRTGLHAADEVIAVSERLAATLRPVVRCTVSYVPNGIDLAPFAPVVAADPEGARVVYVGHLTRRKGLIDLRDAGRLLRDRGVDHEIVLAGGLPDEGAREEASVRDEIGDDVVLLGRVEHDEVPALLGTARVFCLPSWWEATPLSVIEAMAAGRAVVATDVGDVSRMIVSGTTGLLVPPRDPAALADALEVLLTDRERCLRLGAAGRARAEELFDAAEMSDRLLARYISLTADRRQRSPR